MPMPRAVARFNRYPNRLVRRLAPYLPPFLLVTHTGRASGREYRTPVWGFPTEEGFIFALTYGSEADWVRNIVAAGGGEGVYRRRAYTLSAPRLVHGDPRQQALPAIVRLALPLLGVDDFLLVRAIPR